MLDNHHTQRIVLIDDSAEDRARLRSALIKGAPARRYHFREASNGEDGLALCRHDPDWEVDCIITDVQMPRMSGLDLLRQLREEGEDFLPVPVIVLTGTSTALEEASQALSLGAQDYITKQGIHYSMLFRSIDNAIERHAMLRRLRQSEKDAEAANRAKSALIGNISHEIRTPMTAVMGLCDVLMDEPLPERCLPLLKMIHDNGSYLVEIVNDLLDLSKIEAGMLELDSETVFLNQFLDELITLMRFRAEENRTELELIADGLPTAIETDSVRLRQILLNLLSNAIKFTPNGQVQLSVTASRQPEPQLQFVVSDTGCGIAPDDQEAIFQPFIQSNRGTARSKLGTGLGLSICRRLSEALGGQIRVESQLDHGSRFTVTIPWRDSTSLQLDEMKSPSRSLNEILDGCEVLVAEDTPATQLLIRHFIEKEGGNVTMVENGVQMIHAVQQMPDHFKVIVTDVQMPEMGGLEATERLRSLGCQIPIVVLTADALAETREEAFRLGADEVVTKPISRDFLLSRIAFLCENSPNSDCSQASEPRPLPQR